MDVSKIMELIPHRYPFLLVDKVFELEKGESIHALKNVTYNENFFVGHFPGHPVMPGVLIIEALAQASTILVAETLGDTNAENSLVYFTSIDNAKFRKPVVPGDSLHLHAKVAQNRRNLWKMEVRAEVEGKIMTEATISAMMMRKS